tara:strand:+ start:3124 stop:3318 length:195 start_codon:yes stop_codon:yes gene_type:complete
MIKDYSKKDMEAPKSTMKAPTYDDGFIFERDGMFFFKWKGGECGYHSKEDAEAGLKKLSGDGES